MLSDNGNLPESERMDSNHQDLVYDQAVPSYLHIPNNPDAPG
nr:MAG TPA: hypothetical protein [Caudoviricetes sp.]